jgi:transposase
MIPSGVEIYVCTSPVDMRWSFERLGAVVRERFGREPRGGALFVFFGKRRETVKVMFEDRNGTCMFYKRLSTGLFAQVDAIDPNCAYVELNESAFDDLLDGVIIEQAKRPRRKRKPVH